MRRTLLLVLTVVILCAAPAIAFDQDRENRNFSKVQERQAEYNTPDYQARLQAQSSQNEADSLQMQLTDPERNFSGHSCARYDGACARPGWCPGGGISAAMRYA